MSLSFWENYRRGPRKLTAEEKTRIKGLRERIQWLERETGASTEITIFGKKVPSPVGLASGPAPNLRWLRFYAGLGYGILTYKTMRDRAWRGHGMPNLLNVRGDFRKGFVAEDRFTGSMTNSLGMPTPEPEVWKREARMLADSKGDCFFVVSVTATPDGRGEEGMLAQFAELAAAGKRTGADAVELNLSCPNVVAGEGGETYADPSLSGKVVDGVRRAVGSSYPVFVKVGYLDEYGPLVDETFDERVAYVAINSVPGRVRDGAGKTMFLDRGGKAGVCGAAIRGKARLAVSGLAGLRNERRDFKILGLGGVLGAWDALALMDRGADAVESAAGALLDPSLGLRISLGLLKARAGGTERQ
jgi:dihydroorotate dehydrogenase